MKIGIMSMQRIVNCGSFLQAYGLKRIIENLGYEVVFVDYKVEKPLCSCKLDKKKIIKKKFENRVLSICMKLEHLMFWTPRSIKRTIKENNNYIKFANKNLNLTKRKSYRVSVDTLVIGSDEVFNCTQLNPNVGYSLELFGKNANTHNVCTYAASFGNTTIKKIEKYGKTQEIADLLNKMSTISVRDENSYDVVKALTGKEPTVNLDPVLIYEFENEVPDIVNLKDYIIVYAYRNRINETEQKLIKEFAKIENKKIVCIGGYQAFADYYVNCTPFEVLDYFRKADYIFTDTFHGTIMSIINHKKFVTFVRDSVGESYGNSEKLTDLLSRLGLKNRIVNDTIDIVSVIKSDIDYQTVDGIIRDERLKTVSYLESALNRG